MAMLASEGISKYILLLKISLVPNHVPPGVPNDLYTFDFNKTNR